MENQLAAFHHVSMNILGLWVYLYWMAFAACRRTKQHLLQRRACGEDSKENPQPEVPGTDRQQHIQGGSPCLGWEVSEFREAEGDERQWHLRWWNTCSSRIPWWCPEAPWWREQHCTDLIVVVCSNPDWLAPRSPLSLKRVACAFLDLPVLNCAWGS